MKKILAYYSLILVAFCCLVCLFDAQDTETFIGGLLFIPVAYSQWEMMTELKKIEAKTERTELKEEIKKEMQK